MIDIVLTDKNININPERLEKQIIENQ